MNCARCFNTGDFGCRVNWLSALSIRDAFYKSNSIVSSTIITVATTNNKVCAGGAGLPSSGKLGRSLQSTLD